MNVCGAPVGIGVPQLSDAAAFSLTSKGIALSRKRPNLSFEKVSIPDVELYCKIKEFNVSPDDDVEVECYMCTEDGVFLVSIEENEIVFQ